jgi:lanthanide-dependent methanol dehydrogenase
LATAGDVVFYGTLEGYLKAVDMETGKELYRFKTPSGIIGNVFTYERDGRQYVGVLSGIGGWAGIGLAAGLLAPENATAWQNAAGRAAAGRALENMERNIGTAGLGAVGGYAGLSKYTNLGGQLTVFALPQSVATAGGASNAATGTATETNATTQTGTNQ